jgi:hypothetical protein
MRQLIICLLNLRSFNNRACQNMNLSKLAILMHNFLLVMNLRILSGVSELCCNVVRTGKSRKHNHANTDSFKWIIERRIHAQDVFNCTVCHLNSDYISFVCWKYISSPCYLSLSSASNLRQLNHIKFECCRRTFYSYSNSNRRILLVAIQRVFCYLCLLHHWRFCIFILLSLDLHAGFCEH